MATIGERWLIQQHENVVRLFGRHTEEMITWFHPADPEDVKRGVDDIERSDRLSDEEKSRAVFWAGYFYGCAVSGNGW